VTSEKVPYICGPLTELPPDQQEAVKGFYARLADLCQEVLGARAFVPHEHFDPIKHADIPSRQVDAGERRQVCELCSLLIVVAIAPSWGGGIEVEMANRSDVPVIVLVPSGKRVSRLLLGNPAVMNCIEYASNHEAMERLRPQLIGLLVRGSAPLDPDLCDP